MLGLLLTIQSAALTVISAKPAPEIDALFQRTDGWIGADGAYSVPLPKGRVAWLFSDTWVGKIRDGKRTDATIVNNTIGIQKSSFSPLEYSLPMDPTGKPRAQVLPAGERGFYWQQAGAFADGKLYRFLNQVEKTSDPGVFGFRSIGLWLGITADSEKEPTYWHTKQVKLSNTIFEPDRTLVWGSSVLIEGNTAYIYGTDDLRRPGTLERFLVVARVPASKIDDTSQWVYFDGKAWANDFRKAAHIANELATEHSVTRFGSGFIAVYTLNGLSEKIVARYAPKPWGPWSAPTMLYSCPEPAAIPKTFTYAAKAHTSFSKGDEIVLSYVVNSTDFWEVAKNSTLYWPRFVRIRLRTP